MKVRVIAGAYGGRILDAPAGRTTHPMGERIRGALFNSIGAGVEGARILDAFAGTGAIGIEALSRGAAHATFIERDKLAYAILLKNLELLRIGEERAAATKASLGAWLETYTGTKFDFIFADPPYNQPQETLVNGLSALLREKGTLILSRSSRTEPNLPALERTQARPYGEATLDFLIRTGFHFDA